MVLPNPPFAQRFEPSKTTPDLRFLEESLGVPASAKRYIKGLLRWYSEDNRNKTVDHIIDIINKAFNIIDSTYHKEINNEKNKGPFNEDNSKLLQRITIKF